MWLVVRERGRCLVVPGNACRHDATIEITCNGEGAYATACGGAAYCGGVHDVLIPWEIGDVGDHRQTIIVGFRAA